MNVYWLTFRLAADNSYAARRDALEEAVRDAAETWWYETSSFYLFDSPNGIDDIAGSVKAAIDPKVDVVLIGMPELKAARIIGALTDQDVFRLMPFTKKV